MPKSKILNQVQDLVRHDKECHSEPSLKQVCHPESSSGSGFTVSESLID